MSGRGQKRTESVDELPADKRACSSHDRPSTSKEFNSTMSNSSIQTPMNSSHESHDTDIETSSYTSGDGERDSPYGSCDSDHSLRDYYRHQSANDLTKFKKVLSSLSEEVEESVQLVLLNELCDLLSFCGDSSLSSLLADSFSPILVKLARHETSPDIMLMSIRAMTYLCDVNPRSSGFLVRHDAIPVLCQRLMAIEYLDVAEQCLQALEKISREQPLACLQSGAIMAVLGYIDFFATSVQRVALSTVVNICKKNSSESLTLLMEAVPILCNLLQYEDKQLVESVATCVIRIGEQVHHSSDMLDEICKHGLVQQALHLIGLTSRTTLSQQTYTVTCGQGLIGLLVKLVAGSNVAFKTLFEHNISNTVKDMLCTYVLSHGTQSTSMVDGQLSQVHEVLKLLNELLPKVTAKQDDAQVMSEKESFISDNPEILAKFGVDLLPILIQVVNSGANMFACYGCLSVIDKLVHFSTSDMLQSLLQSANFSSFLAGVLTRKDPHVILLALQIVGTIMVKLPHVFLNSFIKEGVLFAVHAMISPDKDLKLTPVLDDMRLDNNKDKRSAFCDVHKCPCFEFDTEKDGTCKIQKDTVQNLAMHIWTTYFETQSVNPEKGVTDILQKLRSLSGELTSLVNKSSESSCSRLEEEVYDLLRQIMSELNKRDCISTFEFVESGVIKSLANFLSSGDSKEKKFEEFGQLLLSCAVPSLGELPLLTLLRRLQSALSSVENFPVISSHSFKLRNSYATVPFGHSTSYQCLKVQFVRENGEIVLHEYNEDVVNVDPFLPLDTIEEYLWTRVSNRDNDSSCSDPVSDSSDSPHKSADVIAPIDMLVDVHELQEAQRISLLSSPGERTSSEQETVDLADVTEVHTDPVELEGGSVNTDHPGCSDSEDISPKLLFYLEGRQLDSELTLYQSILQHQTEAERDDNTLHPSLWSRIYKVTYRRNLTTEPPTSLTSLKLGPIDDILSLLKTLEEINRLRFHLISRERMYSFAEGKIDDLDKINLPVYDVAQNEFSNIKCTEKLEQQMRDPMSVSTGSLPAWCTQLMTHCAFLFGFEARCKYFHLSALGKSTVQISSNQNQRNSSRKKFLVNREKILESAFQMMELHAGNKTLIEVEYSEEVGTGLGPTLEFYTLVCREFQRVGLGLWRDDDVVDENNDGLLSSPFGLFPRPWGPSLSGGAFSEVIKKFDLMGQIVAKAIQDGRVLDIPFSKAFYKLILDKELTVYDIQSFDPALGKTLLEFQAIVERKKYLKSLCDEESHDIDDVYLRNTKIEDLCLDFTLPGKPDYVLVTESDSKMVNLNNLEEYVTLMGDAITKSGIARQIEAFKSGFDQVFPIRHLKVFTEEELERLLCGEHVLWNSNELLDHIKFDHGYTISSPPIVNLLEIMQEFDREQQRAFLQFVTGAPRLPTGGLASLNPKMTIVRKHCGKWIDADLPSVMTCANYLKLPPYSSKDVMKEKLLYAITEGQGSFHLS